MIDYRNEDCFDVFKTIPDNSIALICVDPPYALNFTGKYTPGGSWDKFTTDEFYQFNKRWLTEAYRVLKPNGTMWMFCMPTRIPELFKVIDDVGFHNNLENWKSIQRQKGKSAKDRPKSLREDILHLTKSDKYVWNMKNDLYRYDEPITNTLDISTGKVIRPEFNINDNIFCFKMPYYLSKTEKMIHSCQKSILLQYGLIMNSSVDGDTVFDPFMGSGSSGIASMLADRNYIGTERDKEMYDKAIHWRDSFNVDEYRFIFLNREI